MLKEFREFILRGNVVDLAIAVVIGAAFGAVVTALVADIITPLIAAIGGKPDFSGLTFRVNGSAFRYGHLLNAVISFLIIAAVIFFLVVRPLNALLARRRAKHGPPPEAPAEDVALLTEIRDLLRAGFTPSRRA
jgi:large conductance mechanosensitive channel